MNLQKRKLRLIQFISDLEDEIFFDYIESVIESSGERFGVHLPEIEQNTEKESQNEGEKLLADFYTRMKNEKDKSLRKKILHEEYTAEERLKIALMLRLEDLKNNPDDVVDAEIVFAEMKRKYEKDI